MTLWPLYCADAFVNIGRIPLTNRRGATTKTATMKPAQRVQLTGIGTTQPLKENSRWRVSVDAESHRQILNVRWNNLATQALSNQITIF